MPDALASKKYPQGFEEFWKQWPKERRCEKPKAFAAWKDACMKVPESQLIAAAKAFAASESAQSGFAPYPARWLRNERWQEMTADETQISLKPPEIGKDATATKEDKGWALMLRRLHELHGEAIFRSWFSKLRLKQLTAKALELSSASRFEAEWIQTHYLNDMRAMAKDIFNVNQIVIHCGVK